MAVRVRPAEAASGAAADETRGELRSMLDLLLGPRGRDLDARERWRHLRATCAESAEQADDLGSFLLDELHRARRGLAAAQKVHARLEEVVGKLTAPPLHPATFLRMVTLSGRPAALISQGPATRVVGVAAEVDVDALAPGDEVFLSSAGNALLARSEQPVLAGGETAIFERLTADGRAVLRWRDEEWIVSCGGRLRARSPRRGETVRWDRHAGLALEILERPSAEHLFAQETPAESFADIGGLDEIIAEIKQIFMLHFRHADSAARYRVRRCGAVTLEGAPGTGKTMLAKAVANWVATLTPAARSRFINVKPGSLKSMWYSQTEANIRGLFQSARELAEADPTVPVVLFMDEIDSLAAARSGGMMHIDDRVQQAFAAELNGFEARGNVMVICTTNRIDALDPALVREGRLGDRVITVPRPDLSAARGIFGKYLTPDLPWAGANGDAGAVRGQVVEAALAAIFAPNGAGELAAVRLRDGQRVAVRPSHLVSGAMIAGIANDACRRACLREVTGVPGVRGIGWSDVEVALTRRFEQAARLLTPRNCRSYVNGLPDDIDVVGIERPRRGQVPGHRYVVAD